QWGNIVNGIELTRRIDTTELFGLTTPLLTTSSGAKMGKTAQGAVWLNAEQCSPYDFWQYWRNTEDADVGRFLRLFTELDLEEITRLEALEGAEINQAKIVLANAVTRLCHGAEEAQKAEATAQSLFVQGESSADMPTVEIDAARLAAGIPAFQLLQEAGLADSGGAARRLIRQNGAKLNDAPFADETQPITLADRTAEGHIKLSAGKKRHVRVIAKR
ncbi:MAG: tyrosine--tRNA ligase, partial [Rickettsiales bacterium]|nr:tyrosine--tRNA ligase [Rickettsiales bacterium]